MKIDVLSLMSPAKAKAKREQKLAVAKSKRLSRIKSALAETGNAAPKTDAKNAVDLKTAGKHLIADRFVDAADILTMSQQYKKLCGVYFLICDGSVVYVGQSVDIQSRLGSHANSIPFGSYYYIECDNTQLDLLESIYIHLLNPVLNSQHSSGKKKAPLSADAIISLLGEP